VTWHCGSTNFKEFTKGKPKSKPTVAILESKAIDPNPPHLGTVSTNFYRGQHQDSYTIFDDNYFESNGHYHMAYSHWLNCQRVNKHLNWKDRSPEPSTFILVFDNEGTCSRPLSKEAGVLISLLADALKRVQCRLNRRHQGVLIARISSQLLMLMHLEIEFREEIVYLPVWTDREGTVFVSMLDLLCYLRTNPAISEMAGVGLHT
jgi:hypothetical protein